MLDAAKLFVSIPDNFNIFLVHSDHITTCSSVYKVINYFATLLTNAFCHFKYDNKQDVMKFTGLKCLEYCLVAMINTCL